MTVLTALYTLIIYPIELLFDVVFTVAYRLLGSSGLAIIFLSLAVNFLVLPLYKRADELQAEERAVQEKMVQGIKHIKKTFKGDERFFMLQEYYRINHYKPIYALKSSISLLLQIPFFIAAYNLLSGMQCLQGTAFGFISDLGKEDAMFTIGSFPVNMLPILMTLINIVSGIIYTKGLPLKSKIQVYGLAAIFLVLLYHSPSGLVFYWLLNNVFSLAKNIVGRLVKSSKSKALNDSFNPVSTAKDMKVIMLSCAVFAITIGIMIPASIVSVNPTELVNTFISNPHSPLTYLISSSLTAIGTFLIWVPVFVYLCKGKHIKMISYIFAGLATTTIVNVLLFNKSIGILSGRLIYDRPINYQVKDIIINLIVDIAIVAFIIFIGVKKPRYIDLTLTIILVSSVVSCGYFVYRGYKNTDDQIKVESYDEIKIPFTTTGENVVVIMMDRMVGAYIPYIMEENPDIKSDFDGFTYYPNTISFGQHTNTGAPALFGGYEYTPDQMNARSDELLVDKHNEALQVLPVLFSNEGWTVTVGDQPYANYKWLPNTDLYDDNDAINAYALSLSIENDLTYAFGDDMEDRLNRNFFCYGIMRSLPFLFQPLVYDEGSYNHLYNESLLNAQPGTYLRERLVLESLPDFTEITDSEQNCFFVFENNLTHADEVNLLSDEKYATPPVVNNIPMHLDDDEDYKHYQCSVEACILLGQWFDYLRENNVYDNTRIIIVADHGFGMNNFDELLVTELGLDAEWFNPVLMVKDFNQTGFTVSNDFMTNADTPYLAVNGIVDNPVNPFTNKPILYNDHTGEFVVYCSNIDNVLFNHGTKYKESDGYWLTVHDNIWDDDNWSLYEGETT